MYLKLTANIEKEISNITAQKKDYIIKSIKKDFSKRPSTIPALIKKIDNNPKATLNDVLDLARLYLLTENYADSCEISYSLSHTPLPSFSNEQKMAARKIFICSSLLRVSANEKDIPINPVNLADFIYETISLEKNNTSSNNLNFYKILLSLENSD